MEEINEYENAKKIVITEPGIGMWYEGMKDTEFWVIDDIQDGMYELTNSQFQEFISKNEELKVLFELEYGGDLVSLGIKIVDCMDVL